MRIVVIGASGTIGKAVVAALAAGNEVVAVGKSSGDFRVDLGSKPSIEALFKSLGRIDAVVSAPAKPASAHSTLFRTTTSPSRWATS